MVVIIPIRHLLLPPHRLDRRRVTVSSAGRGRSIRSWAVAKVIALNLSGFRCFFNVFFMDVAADVIMWKQRRLTFGVLVILTFFYLLVEWSGLSLLSIASDTFLVLVIIQFLRANSASLLKK